MQFSAKYHMGILWICYGYPMVRDATLNVNRTFLVQCFRVPRCMQSLERQGRLWRGVIGLNLGAKVQKSFGICKY